MQGLSEQSKIKTLSVPLFNSLASIEIYLDDMNEKIKNHMLEFDTSVQPFAIKNRTDDEAKFKHLQNLHCNDDIYKKKYLKYKAKYLMLQHHI